MTSNTRSRNRRGEGDLLREELLETAGHMLAELGDAERLSLRGLAAEIGISAPSIYRHFPDKAALLLAVAQREFGQFDSVLNDASGTEDLDPFERLRAVGHAYLRFGAELPTHYRILFGGVGLPPTHDAAELASASGPSSFSTLLELARACLDAVALGERDAFGLAIEAWALVHGLVDLPIGNTTFPWPDTHAILDAWVDRLAATPPAELRVER